LSLIIFRLLTFYIFDLIIQSFLRTFSQRRTSLRADKLLLDLDVGVTYLNGVGAYSGQEKKVLMCASRKHIFPRIREVVSNVDDMAFMIVGSAQEIFGEGFKNHKGSDL
jgi:uncharacterized membrane-anchored protein YitT (DUF2179 family)